MNTTQSSERRAKVAPPAEQIVIKYHRIEVTAHPFFVALANGPVNLEAVYVLMANLQQGISRHFVPWLARTIERLEDRRAASLLAKQLYDELGAGDCSQIHSILLERFVSALASWCPRAGDRHLLTAGRNLARDGARPFFARDIYEGMGALMVGEIFAEKMDTCLANVMRRQTSVTGDALTWLDVHEKLEVNHAEDSNELAVLIPDRGPHLAATWRGAGDQWTTLWRFLDEVQAILKTVQSRT